MSGGFGDINALAILSQLFFLMAALKRTRCRRTDTRKTPQVERSRAQALQQSSRARLTEPCVSFGKFSGMFCVQTLTQTSKLCQILDTTGARYTLHLFPDTGILLCGIKLREFKITREVFFFDCAEIIYYSHHYYVFLSSSLLSWSLFLNSCIFLYFFRI